MIRSILRLSSFGTGQSRWRTAGIMLGIAVGVGLLLTLLGAAQGLNDRHLRSAWLNAAQIIEDPTAVLTDDTIMVARFVDYAADQPIDRIDVAFTPDTTIPTPWQAPLPEPGTYYASPAMIDLIESLPDEQLADRFGERIGVIPESALASPDSLVILAGNTPQTLDRFGGGVILPSLEGEPPGANPVYRIVLIIGGLAMFLPVLLLISITTQLGGAERAERLSTLRLIGATPQSLTRAAALEMAAIALIGSLVGVIGWRILRPVGARFRIDEGRFFPSDLDVAPVVILLVVIGTVAATAIAAGLRIARMGIGPLGVTRERSERRPTIVRILPMLAGIGLVSLVTMIWKESQFDATLLSLAIIGGYLLTSLGIIWAGPWLTYCASRIAARFSGSASGVIASSRIQRHPNATFRSVSGLVLAVFTVSVFAGSASSVLEADDPRDGERLFPLTLVYAPPVPGASEAALAPLISEIEAIPGVTGVVVAMADPENYGAWLIPREDAPLVNVAIDDASAWVRFDWYGYIWSNPDDSRPILAGEATLPDPRPEMILVANDGRDGVIDMIRTRLQQSGNISSLARTRPDDRDMSTRDFVNSLATLAYIGIAITILIAGISLTISTAASMLERKRVFGLMRLMGMPNRVIDRIVTFEAVAPLVAIVALSIGLGFLIAWLLVEGLSYTRSLHAPDGRFYLAIFGSLALAIVSVFAVTGLVRRNTEISQTRFE